jgi:hypothetical protein
MLQYIQLPHGIWSLVQKHLQLPLGVLVIGAVVQYIPLLFIGSAVHSAFYGDTVHWFSSSFCFLWGHCSLVQQFILLSTGTLFIDAVHSAFPCEHFSFSLGIHSTTPWEYSSLVQQYINLLFGVSFRWCKVHLASPWGAVIYISSNPQVQQLIRLLHGAL